MLGGVFRNKRLDSDVKRIMLLAVVRPVTGHYCSGIWRHSVACQCPPAGCSGVCATPDPEQHDWLPQHHFFFESRILTCLTYTSRRGSQHRGQTAEQEDTKARKAKLRRPRTAAQGSRSHKQQAKQASPTPLALTSCGLRQAAGALRVGQTSASWSISSSFRRMMPDGRLPKQHNYWQEGRRQGGQVKM